MAFYNGLVPLRDILAEIYPAESLARAVAVEAGLKEELIDFKGSAFVCWKQILSVAQNGRQVQAIIDVARNHFPQNEELIEAEEVFRNTPLPSGGSGLEGLPDSSNSTIHLTQQAEGKNIAQAGPGGTATVNDSSSHSVFDQRGQTVGEQYNIDGDYQAKLKL